MPPDPRIALVTGAGSGIGRAVAVRLAGAGYRVMLCGRRKALLDGLAQEIGAERSLVVEADGSRRAEPTFDVRHVADAVLYTAQLPLDPNVPSMTVAATGMPPLGRG